MKPSGPKHERETVILFNEDSGLATIGTASGTAYQKYKKYGLEIVSETDRWTTFKCPKSWIKVNRPRRLSQKTRTEMAARLALSRRTPHAQGAK